MPESQSKQPNLLAWCAYLTVFALITFPLFDLAITVYPWSFGAVKWRFGATGLFSSGLITPLLGILIGVVTAKTFEHRAVAMVLSLGCAFLALIILPTIPLFALDSVQLTSFAPPELRHSFLVSWLLGIFKLIVLLTTSLALAYTSFQIGRRSPTDAKAPGRPRVDQRLVAKPRSESRSSLPGPLAEAVDTIENDLRGKPNYAPSKQVQRR